MTTPWIAIAGGVLGATAAALALATAGAPAPAPEHLDDWLARRPYPAVPIGPAPRYQPAAAAGPRRTCRAGRRHRHLAHLELFAAGKVVIVPAGLGVGGRWRLVQGRLAGGTCRQRLFTTEPTGVVLVAGRAQKVGDLFRIWGRRLGPRRMLSFGGRVRGYVAGRRWTGDPRRIPLGHHAQVVLEVGPYIRPHPSYRFPRSLEP